METLRLVLLFVHILGFAALFWVVLQPLWTLPTSTLGTDVPVPGTQASG